LQYITKKEEKLRIKHVEEKWIVPMNWDYICNTKKKWRWRGRATERRDDGKREEWGV